MRLTCVLILKEAEPRKRGGPVPDSKPEGGATGSPRTPTSRDIKTLFTKIRGLGFCQAIR